MDDCVPVHAVAGRTMLHFAAQGDLIVPPTWLIRQENRTLKFPSLRTLHFEQPAS